VRARPVPLSHGTTITFAGRRYRFLEG